MTPIGRINGSFSSLEVSEMIETSKVIQKGEKDFKNVITDPHRANQWLIQQLGDRNFKSDSKGRNGF